MDATTLVAVVGIVGTLLGAVGGPLLTSLYTYHLEEKRERKQALRHCHIVRRSVKKTFDNLAQHPYYVSTDEDMVNARKSINLEELLSRLDLCGLSSVSRCLDRLNEHLRYFGDYTEEEYGPSAEIDSHEFHLSADDEWLKNGLNLLMAFDLACEKARTRL